MRAGSVLFQSKGRNIGRGQSAAVHAAGGVEQPIDQHQLSKPPRGATSEDHGGKGRVQEAPHKIKMGPSFSSMFTGLRRLRAASRKLLWRTLRLLEAVATCLASKILQCPLRQRCSQLHVPARVAQLRSSPPCRPSLSHACFARPATAAASCIPPAIERRPSSWR